MLDKDEFKNLSLAFNKIEQKIASKIQIINELHNADVKKVENKFVDEGVYCQHINEHRDKLIHQTKSTLEAQITEVNIFLESSDINESLKNLNINHESNNQRVSNKFQGLKQDFLYFKKIHYIPLEKLYTYDFTQPLDLNLIHKYYRLLKLNKTIAFKIPNSYTWPSFFPRDIFNVNFHELPNRKLVCCVLDEAKKIPHRLILVDKNGTIVRTNRFNVKAHYPLSYDLSISKSKIVLLIKRKGRAPHYVEIYDFDLNLIDLFRLSYEFECQTIINNEEVLFTRENRKTKCALYNIETRRLEFINFQLKDSNSPFYVSSSDVSLIGFNREFFYFSSDLKKNFSLLTIMSRASGVYLKTSFNKKHSLFSSEFKVDSKSNIYAIDKNKDLVKVYDSSGYNILCQVALKKALIFYKFTLLNRIMLGIPLFSTDGTNVKIFIDEY